MADVSSEASLRFTSTGADKAAADARKLEDSLRNVQRQAQRTAASLKSPLGITAAAAPSVRAAAPGRAGGRSLKAPPSGDKLGGPLGIKLAEAVIDAFQKRAAVLTAISAKEQAAAARASVAQAEATTKAVEAEAKATAKAAEAGLKSSGKAGEAKAKSTAKTAEVETKASTKAAETQLKTTVQAGEAKAKATVRSGDAELKAAVQAGEAKAKAAAKAADAEAKAALKSSKAAEARKQAVATSLRTASQIIAPVTGLIPPVLTGIAAAGSGLGLLGAAAIAVAAPVTLLIKSFKWISDAAEAASENFLKAQRVMRGGPDVAAEQERQQRALTALNVTIGSSADKFINQFNKLAVGLRSGSFSDAAQKQLDKFGITKDKLKEFEDKTGNIDPFKAFEKFVETQDRIKEAIAAADKGGDASKIEKAKSVWDEWIKTLDQIGPEFSRAVQGASKETIAAGRKHQQDLDAAMPLGSRADASDNADKFGIAINRMKDTWNRMFQIVAEGAMPAATAAVDKWADVLKAVAPKLAEVGKYLTKEAWSGLGDLADYLKQTIDDPDVKAALSYLKGEWLAFWNILKGVGAEVRALVGTFDEVKQAVKGFFSEGKTIWETTKQEFETIKGLVATIGDMGENTKREWEAVKPTLIQFWDDFIGASKREWAALKPIAAAVGATLKQGWDDFVADAKEQWPAIKELAAGVWREITGGWHTFEGAVRTGFQTLKDFIVGLFKGGSILKEGQVPPSMMPGYQPSSYGGDGSDISLDNARIQSASFGTGTAGAEMRGNIDRALIHVSGTMQAIIQNASIMGRTGLDTGPAGVQNASWGGAGGGFGGAGTGGTGGAPSAVSRIPGVGSHDFGGTSLGGAASGGAGRGAMAPLGAAGPGGTGTARPNAEVSGAIEKAAKDLGVDPRILWAKASVESSYKAGAKSPMSSAAGLGQILSGTWKEIAGYPEAKKYGITGDPSERFDPYKSAVGSMLYSQRNVEKLKSQGLLTDEMLRKSPGLQYIPHNLGPDGAARFLKGLRDNPDAPVSDSLNPKEISNNPSIYKKGGQVLSFKEAVKNIESGPFGQGYRLRESRADLGTPWTGQAGAAPTGVMGQGTPSGPATPGAPTNSRLSVNAQTYGMEGADPRLKEILHAASSHLPPGYTAEVVAAGRNAAAPGFHPKGKAIDLRILDPQGNPIEHRGEDTTGLYTRMAQAASGEQQARYPELTGKLAWGGAFGTSASNPNEKDLMHFDIGGERGRFTQNRLSNLGVLPGAQFGGGAIQRPDVARNQPIIVPPRGGDGIDRSTVAAQGPVAEGAASRTFKSASEGAAFGQSAAENIRKGLEGTNIPVSGVPATSRGVSPNTGPKSTGGDAPTTDV